MFSVSTRQRIILRADNLKSDDFFARFSKMFGNGYPGLASQTPNIIIGGIYGRHEGVSFRHLHYQGDFTTSLPDPMDEITFVIPTEGRIVFNHTSESCGAPQTGLAIDKADIRSMRFIDNHAHHGISLNRGALTERLSTLLGKPVLQRLVFDSTVDLHNPALQGVKGLIAMATGVEFDALIHAGTLMPSRLREMLIDAVLEIWPHNFTQALRLPAPMIAPRHVKLAVEYIQAHPEQLLSGVDLARLSNVSHRSLQEGFRRFMGVSIVSYQRQVRLQYAYDALAYGAGASVAHVALRFGFSNVGRFCQYFQSAYGLRPADVKSGKRPRR